MNCRISYSWNHDFPRLIRDTGFQFTSKCPKILIDWNAVGNINIDKVINSREVITLEQHLNDIIYYRIQEEESKLLDQRFLKLFRLSQLAIEYLLFCLHYLDEGLVQLQKNLIDLTKETENLKKENKQKEKKLNKHKKQINELQNILSNSLPAIFTCSVCNKQFISMEYLEAHQLKRHPEKSSPKNDHITQNHTKKYEEQLQLEIKQLKEKLNNTERMLNLNLSKSNNSLISNQDYVEKYSLVNQSTQCNLLELSQITTKDEEQIKIIKNELQKWKEQEQVEFLTQLEQLKNKLYIEIEKLQPPTVEGKSNENVNNMLLIKSEEGIKTPNILKKESSSNLEIETIAESLTKQVNFMVKTHIDQLQDQLVKQEKKWEECLIQLEQKYNTEVNQMQLSLPVKGDDMSKIDCFKNNVTSSLDTSTSETPLPIKGNITNEISSKYFFKAIQEIQNGNKFQSERGKIIPINKVKKTDGTETDNSTQSELCHSVKKNEIPEIFVENNNKINQTKQPNKNDSLENTVNCDNLIYEPQSISRNIDTNSNKTSPILYLKSKSKQYLISKPIISQYNKVVQQIKQKKQSDVLKRNENIVEGQANKNEISDREFMNYDVKHTNSNNKTKNEMKETDKIKQEDSRNICIVKDKKILNYCEVTIKKMLAEKLHEMGIDPNWQTLPSETLKKQLCNLQHSQKLISKSYPSYFQLCNNILSVVEKQTTEHMKNKKYSLDIDLQQKKILKSRIFQNKNMQGEIPKMSSSTKKTTVSEYNGNKQNISVQENIKTNVDNEKWPESRNMSTNSFLYQDKNLYKPIKLQDQSLTTPVKLNSVDNMFCTKYLKKKRQISKENNDNINDCFIENENKDILSKNSNKSNMSTCSLSEISTSSSSESLKQELFAQISIGRSVLKKADSVGSLTKKKVFFDIHSSQSEESHPKSNEEKFSSMYKTKKEQNINDILADKQDLRQHVTNIPIKKKNIVIDDDETTSISSSIFEGNKDSTNINNEKNSTKMKEVRNLKELDDLIISDFDSLS